MTRFALSEIDFESQTPNRASGKNGKKKTHATKMIAAAPTVPSRVRRCREAATTTNQHKMGVSIRSLEALSNPGTIERRIIKTTYQLTADARLVVTIRTYVASMIEMANSE